jgi:transposase
MPSLAGLFSSPYDTEARYSTKRDLNWVGYKVYLTETCDEQKPLSRLLLEFNQLKLQ